jgi:hypothetical protein
LFAVLTRYNLVNSGLCSTRVANIFVVYLPWGLSWLFYQGSAVSELLDWGGILFTGALAFLLPLFLAIRVLRQQQQSEDNDDSSSVAEPASVGSVDVYLGLFKSRGAELRATVIVMIASFTCVAVAIMGQLYYDEQQEMLIHETSVNDTTHN